MSNIIHDPDRISPIVELLSRVWRQNPHMRLGQLIVNICPHNDQIFYISDNDIERLLKEYSK